MVISSGVIRSSSQLIERSRHPDLGVIRSSSQLIEPTNRDHFYGREVGHVTIVSEFEIKRAS